MVAKHAAQDFKVILTGHGGDELFGYPVFSYMKHGIMGIRSVTDFFHHAYFLFSDVKRKLRLEEGRGLPVLWPVDLQSKLIGTSKSDLQPWTQLQSWTENFSDRTDQIFITYLKAYLPGLLIVEDKVSMAHSLEARTPFLSNELLEFSLSISPYKINGLPIENGDQTTYDEIVTINTLINRNGVSNAETVGVN